MASLDPSTAYVAPRATPAVAEPPLSWSAIWAGAAVSVAVSLTLTTVAAGLGFHFAVPGVTPQAALDSFTPEAGAYAMGAQVLSAALGGYMAGRLRHVWLAAHGDEAHFRDTAHGLIAWGVATLVGALLAAMILGPAAQTFAVHAALVPPPSPAAAERAANIATQSAFFLGLGMVLSAFVSAVAARLGGHRTEEMHAKGLA